MKKITSSVLIPPTLKPNLDSLPSRRTCETSCPKDEEPKPGRKKDDLKLVEGTCQELVRMGSVSLSARMTE